MDFRPAQGAVVCCVVLTWSLAATAAITISKTHPAYQKGRREADAEWQSNTPTMYWYGYPNRHDGLDRDTGLPRNPIAGCVVDASIVNRAAGHNERIKELIAEHGLPATSRKEWLDDILKPERYFARAVAAGGPIQLAISGKAVPRDAHALRLRGMPTGDPDGGVYLRIELTTGGATRPVDFPLGHYDAAQTQLLWGPKGADVAFFRWSQLEHENYAGIDRVFGVLDLRTGRWLFARIVRQPR